MGLADQEVAIVGPVTVGVLLDHYGDFFNGTVQLIGYGPGVIHRQEGEHLQSLVIVVDVLLAQEEQAFVHNLAGVEIAVVVGVGVVPKFSYHALFLPTLGRRAGYTNEVHR